VTPRPKLTPAERRERNRLRSERWRRAHGIGPRKAARKPTGLVPETGEGRQEAALAAREAMLDRMAWQMAELRESLDRCAAFHAAMRVELDRPVPFVW
jgi:hypothetical protein